MIRILKCFFVFIVVSFQGVAYAQDRPGLGVMDITPLNLNDETLVSAAKVISQLVSHELAATGVYEMVERERLQDILREQGLGLTGCTSDSCVIEIGRLLNAPKMAVGSLGHLGRKHVLTLRIIDVELGVWEGQGTQSGIYELEELDKLVKPLIDEVVYGKVMPAREAEEVPVIEQEKRPTRERPDLKSGKETRFLVSLHYSLVDLTHNDDLVDRQWDVDNTGVTASGLVQRFQGEGRIWWGVGVVLQYNDARAGGAGGTGLYTAGSFLFAGTGGPGDKALQVGLKVGGGIMRLHLNVRGVGETTQVRPAFMGAGTVSLRLSRKLSASLGVQAHGCQVWLDDFGMEGGPSVTFFSLQTGLVFRL
jgi:hypothetical protein